MPRTNNGGPPCPKPQRLRDLIEFIGNEIEPMEESEHVSGKIFADACLDLIDALDWLATSLENRSLYHKKQQLKNKNLRALAKEYGLDGQAEVMTREMLHEFVSTQPVTKDEIDIEFPTPGDDNERS